MLPKKQTKEITMKTSKTSPQETLPKVHLNLSHYDFFLSLIPLVSLLKCWGDARLFAYKQHTAVYSILFTCAVRTDRVETCSPAIWCPGIHVSTKKKKKNILSMSDKSKDLTYGHTVARPQVRSQMNGVREGPGELQTMSTSFIYINQHFR